jgi:hypothetical protein
LLTKGAKHITDVRKDNFHEFKGENENNGCAFLDIIFPDYNETDRPCEYFNHE